MNLVRRFAHFMPPWPDVKAKTIFFINIQFGKFEITEDLEKENKDSIEILKLTMIVIQTGDVLADNPINHDVM